ncbi:MAG TPA: hypothetical protein VJP88_11255, partial [Caulobacteraceae bacterium]|nr:hypothetical protein [Caulobacteraceae bacterium]
MFFLLAPPPEVMPQLLAAARDFAGSPAPHARLARNPHVSLLGLGDLEELSADDLQTAINAASTLT